MTNMTLLNRPGLAAIAAATAFLATPALAQDAAPSAEPAPIVADEPLPAETTAPAAASDPLVPAATNTTKRTTRTTRPARSTSAPVRTARAPASVVRSTAPAAPAAPVEPTSVDPAMVAPLPEPVPATPAPAPVASVSMIDNDLLPVAGAAGLGILALAGAGFVLRRRRRDEDELVEQVWHEPAMSQPLEPAALIVPAPLVATSPAAVPAFNWGRAPLHPAPVQPYIPEPTMSRIEAAKRGPTPDNPSASLKKRLARAAFFDKRDKMVAAGKAVPVDAMAGLPEAWDPPEPQPEPGAQSAPRPVTSRSFQSA